MILNLSKDIQCHELPYSFYVLVNHQIRTYPATFNRAVSLVTADVHFFLKGLC